MILTFAVPCGFFQNYFYVGYEIFQNVHSFIGTAVACNNISKGENLSV